ncbi:hypothetical protein M0802_011220 [Mischocyttarus mexicanus]|nr:hypothetical protein M0802_011220 [Mischocyttarus mexicanus]
MKRNCDCCKRVINDNHICNNDGINIDNVKKNCNDKENSKISSRRSSLTSCDCSSKDKSIWDCKTSKIKCSSIKKCMRDDDSIVTEICQNDINVKPWRSFRNIKLNESSSRLELISDSNDDVCEKFDLKECNELYNEDNNNSCRKFGCLKLDDPEVCTRIPSIIQHIEQCKKNFIEIIKASLMNIGKTKNPEEIIRSTLCTERAKEIDRLLKTRKPENTNTCERSSSSDQNELEYLQMFSKDDFLSTVCDKFEVSDKLKSNVCGSRGINNVVVPCTKNTNKLNELKNKFGDYKDEEISEFVKIIDHKLREELTKNLRKNICADDSLVLKNSYYCVATLCPCMTKNYSFNGPLILGPFNFGSKNEQINTVCENNFNQSEDSVSSSFDTINSFHYSDCIADNDSTDCNDSSTNSSNASSRKFISSKLVEVNKNLFLDFKCNETESSRKITKCRNKKPPPIVLEHHSSYVSFPDRRAEEHLEKSYSKKSEQVAKWGKCYDLVDSVFYERDERIQICEEMGLDMKIDEQDSKIVSCKKESKNTEDKELFLTRVCGLDELCKPKLSTCKRKEMTEYDECENICGKLSHTCRIGFDGSCITGDDFDNLERFHDIGTYGFAKLCRKLFKWVHCISKNWHDLRSYPHIVVHLPSLNYNDVLKCRARKTFDYLQNIQMGRIGWLDDPNVEVLYVFPTPQSEELLTILEDLITTVRPDINVKKRLSMLRPKPKCLMKKCVSGSANLFFSPDVYRRVRFLTAGRHAFILPGVIDQKNIFIGCELKIPIMGPPLQFQKRLLSKSYVMELLDVNKIQHPPFLHVHSFGQLCRGMAVMIIQYPIYKIWFVKIDNGFYGYQTAIIRLKTGGIIQACPNNYYNVLSIGVFIEHDLAKPVIITAAEIIHFGRDIRNDMAYFLPQNKILLKELDQLVDDVGTILRNEHVVGYFGIDLVSFRDQFDVQQIWVIDIDPYYTDLIAFSDWVKFCLGPFKDENKIYMKEIINESSKTMNIIELLKNVNRHAICCGKLFGTGLSKYCGQTLINLCKQNQIYYDNQEKIGSMVYPTDSHNRALNVVTINSTRLLTINKFIETLKVLNQLLLSNNVRETFVDTVDLSNNFKSMQ